MNKKYAIPLIVAAGLLGVMAGSLAAFAADQSEEGQSAIKDAWLHGNLESALLIQ